MSQNVRVSSQSTPIRGVLPGIVWTFDDPISVASSVSLSPFANIAWVSQDLNTHRLQRFTIDGTGIPLTNIPSVTPSENTSDCAADADLVAFAVETNTVTLYAFDSTSDIPLWDFTFPANSTNIQEGMLRVSRDGGVVCCAIRDDGPPEATRLYVFDGPTGGVIGTWDYPDRITGIDLTDDGTLCLVSEHANGRLIDTATQTEIFTGSVTGGGGYGKISGNGDVIVLGGFNLRIYRKVAGSYVLSRDFAPADRFFTEVGVSAGGSTVAAMGINFFTSLETNIWVFDVASDTILGQYDTSGTGIYQDSPVEIVVSDNGSTIAAASWGTQNNDHPEVLVLNRAANLVGSIDTPGSPLTLDLSADGVFLVVGSKADHANVSGNGGRVTMYQIRDAIDPATVPQFTRIADTATMIPDTNETYDTFAEPAIRDGDVTFYGRSVIDLGAAMAEGIYATTDGVLHAIADLTTPIPDQAGSFTRFWSRPSISQGDVAFAGGDRFGFFGVYVVTDAGLAKLADTNTQIPGQVSNFKDFGSYISIHNGDVAFSGRNQSNESVLVAYIENNLRLIADFNVPIPGGSTEFEFLFTEYYPIENGKVAHRGGSNSEPAFGIYTDLYGPRTIVVDLDTPMPGELVDFGFVGLAHMRDGGFAFGGSDMLPIPTRTGLYTLVDGVLTAEVDLNTAAPDGTGTFANLFEPCFNGRDIAFRGVDQANTTGLYTTLGGSLRSVVRPNDVLDGRTVSFINVGFECMDANQIAFQASFTDGSKGVYVATYPGFDRGDLDGDGNVGPSDYAVFEQCVTEPIGTVVGDFNRSSFVDATDYAIWRFCATGPAGIMPDGCTPMDFDLDGDADLLDYGELQRRQNDGYPPLSTECHSVDFNGDRDVDLADYDILVRSVQP